MALTSDNVRKIAALARLRLSAAEEVRFAEQLGKIVDYIDQLQQYAPASSGDGPEEVGEHEAGDAVGPCLPREAFLANAPAVWEGFLLVPEIKGSDDGG